MLLGGLDAVVYTVISRVPGTIVTVNKSETTITVKFRF